MGGERYLVYGKEPGQTEVQLLFNFSTNQITLEQIEKIAASLLAGGCTEVSIKTEK